MPFPHSVTVPIRYLPQLSTAIHLKHRHSRSQANVQGPEARLITRPPVPRDRFNIFSSYKSNDAQSQPLKRYLARERDRLGGS